MPQAQRLAPRCNTLVSFDSNGDGTISGGDRYWRHLYLWIDDDDDGALAEDEVEHLFEHDIRSIAVDLDRYGDRRGLSGDVDVQGGAIRLRLVASRHDVEAVLVVDASGLRRGGELELVDASGTTLTGMRAFEPGQQLRRDGELVPLGCP